MKLNMIERMVIAGLLPKEGNFLTLRTVREHQMKLSPSEAELKKFGIRQDGDQIRFDNPEGLDKEVEVEFGELMANIIVKELEKLDKDEKLKPEQFTVYEKFIKGGKE